MRLIVLALAGCLLPLAACAANPAPSPTPGATGPVPVVAEGAWVRTTEGSADPTMTGLFLTLTNPGEKDVTLTSATSDVAEITQIHEMVAGADGKMMMQEARNGVKIPAGGHLHLKPGSYHIMLMKLTKPLAIGDSVHATLRLSDGAELKVTAPVKKFVEEEDHYHGTASPSGPMSGTPATPGASVTPSGAATPSGPAATTTSMPTLTPAAGTQG